MNIKELHRKLQQVAIDNLKTNFDQFWVVPNHLQNIRNNFIQDNFLQKHLSRLCDLIIFHHYVLKTNAFVISLNGEISFPRKLATEKNNIMEIFDNFYGFYIMQKLEDAHIIMNDRWRTRELWEGVYEGKSIDMDLDKHFTLKMKDLEIYVYNGFQELKRLAIENSNLPVGQQNNQLFAQWFTDWYTWNEIIGSLEFAMEKVWNGNYPVYSQFPGLN